MRLIKGLSISICLLVSSQCLAGPAKSSFSQKTGSTSKASAIAFVDEYYRHLKNGISLGKLNLYWHEKKFYEFNRVARLISKVSGNRLDIERQRMLDIDHANTLCKKVELIDIKTTWKFRRRAKLTYSVSNQCKDWLKPSTRLVILDYLKQEDDWAISSIINTEK